MFAIVVIGCLSFWVMCLGLVIGEGVLRVGGLAGVTACLAIGVLLDLLARHRKPLVEVEPESDAWQWPRRAA